MPGVDPNFLDAYSVQYNLGIQHAITNKLTLDVAFVGNKGYNEQGGIDLNQPPLGTGWNAPFTAAQLAAYNAANSKVHCQPETWVLRAVRSAWAKE